MPGQGDAEPKEPHTAGAAAVALRTVGYINTNPISVTINGQLPDGAMVSACFDDGCTPATVDVVDGDRFEIPQEAPFRTDDSVNPPVLARIVVAATDGATLVDQQLEVHTAQDNPISACPGPFHYDDLTLDVP